MHPHVLRSTDRLETWGPSQVTINGCVHIYTDGACKGNAGARSSSNSRDAGWASIVYLTHQHVNLNQPHVELFGPVISPQTVSSPPSVKPFYGYDRTCSRVSRYGQTANIA